MSFVKSWAIDPGEFEAPCRKMDLGEPEQRPTSTHLLHCGFRTAIKRHPIVYEQVQPASHTGSLPDRLLPCKLNLDRFVVFRHPGAINADEAYRVLTVFDRNTHAVAIPRKDDSFNPSSVWIFDGHVGPLPRPSCNIRGRLGQSLAYSGATRTDSPKTWNVNFVIAKAPHSWEPLHRRSDKIKISLPKT
jgi:hypothetical protein